MHINFHKWLLVCVVLVGTCFVLTFARGGRGGGGGGRSGGGSYGGRSSSSGGSSYGSGRSSSSGGSSYGSGRSTNSGGSSQGSGASSGGGSSSISRGSSYYGSKPSPSLPSSSYGRPSTSYRQPLSHSRHSYSYRPSYSFSSDSDYEPVYRLPSYTTYRPYLSFPSYEPVTIPPIFRGSGASGGFHQFHMTRPEKNEDCQPYDSLKLPCPPGYRELQNFKSITDLIESDRKYRNTPSSRIFHQYNNPTESNAYQFNKNPLFGSSQMSGVRNENCSPYSELSLPCPIEYESILRESNSPYSTSTKSNYKDSSSETKDNTKQDEEVILKEPSVSTVQNNQKRRNNQKGRNNRKGRNKKIQAQSKNDSAYARYIDTRYPEHYLGRYTWQPNSGSPAPSYMNYIGIPRGINMNEKSHRRKGFIGSLMSLNKSESSREKQTKYHGVFPSPYGIKHVNISDSEIINTHFLKKHNSSAALYAIFPFMIRKDFPKPKKMRFLFVSMYMRPRRSHLQRYYDFLENGYEDNPDILYDDYLAKCQQPLNGKNGKSECMSTPYEIECNASCINGYQFPQNKKLFTSHCWHVTGIWRPQKNFPGCEPMCNGGCQNGGKCIEPDKCRCMPEFRGNQCQYHFTVCDIRSLTAEDESITWNCRHFKNETVCKIRCKEPAQFESLPADEYKCTVEGVWTPDTLPPCTV